MSPSPRAQSASSIQLCSSSSASPAHFLASPLPGWTSWALPTLPNPSFPRCLPHITILLLHPLAPPPQVPHPSPLPTLPSPCFLVSPPLPCLSSLPFPTLADSAILGPRGSLSRGLRSLGSARTLEHSLANRVSHQLPSALSEADPPRLPYGRATGVCSTSTCPLACRSPEDPTHPAFPGVAWAEPEP